MPPRQTTDKAKSVMHTLWRESGAGMVEYVLLIALIALIAIPTFTPLQIAIKKNFCRLLVQQVDVSQYFDDSTGRCKRGLSPIMGYYW
jgi:Flp pilus assembly pilin Flp